MGHEDHKDSLAVFDTLDLDNPKERRLAVYALNDYYGAILADVGEDSLDFWDRDLEKGINHQWNKARSRLDELDDVEIPGEFDTGIKSVHGIRNKISHNFKKNPPVEILKDSRELAPEWANWITAVAEDYERHQESLTATEALIQVGRRALQNVKDSPLSYPFGLHRQQELLNEDANQLKNKLESFSGDDEVSRELASTITDIIELERDKESLEDELEKREEIEQKKQKRRDEIRKEENTHPVVVTQAVDDFGKIVVVTNEYGKPDRTYSIDIHHQKTPDEVREELRDLEANDQVHLRIEDSLRRDSKGQIKTDSYIAEVR